MTHNPQEPMSFGEQDEQKYKNIPMEKFWPEYIYDISPGTAIVQHNELQSLIDFSDEHQRKIGPFGLENQVIRAGCLALITIPYITAILFEDLRYFLVPFTNWTLILTTLTLMLSMWAGYDDYDFGKNSLFRHSRTNASFGRALSIQTLLHLLYTISLMCNFVVMTIYWSLLHKSEMESEGKILGKRYHLILVHSIPGITCLVNAWISNIRLKFGFWKLISMIVSLYTTFLYLFWLKTGRQQYFFLDFNQQKKAFVVVNLINLFATGFYLIFVQIDSIVKKKLRDHYGKINNYDEFQDGVQLKQYNVLTPDDDDENDLESLLNFQNEETDQ